MLAAAAVLGLSACGDDNKSETQPSQQPPAQAGTDQGPVHVHGLGIDPADGSLYIATHTGLFRAPRGAGKAARVGTSEQDVMGFSIPAKGRFLGSGHPAPNDANQQPNLGLIESRDGGRTWKDIALSGAADFHVLRSEGKRVYGFDSTGGRLMVSSDGGRSWEERRPPGPMIDLAIAPDDPDHVVASSDQGLFASTNEGRSWRPLRATAPGLLAWPAPRRLYRIDVQGGVGLSPDAGSRWREGIGSIGGQPAAFIAAGRDLYAALPEGTVKRSTDGGASWAVRSTP